MRTLACAPLGCLALKYDIAADVPDALVGDPGRLARC
jgi:hypothetical protein